MYCMVHRSVQIFYNNHSNSCDLRVQSCIKYCQLQVAVKMYFDNGYLFLLVSFLCNFSFVFNQEFCFKPYIDAM